MKKCALSASAATTTVLILGSVATIVVTFMLLQSTENIFTAKVVRDGKQAEYSVMACAEVAAKNARDSSLYTGNETVTLTGQVTCTIGTRTTVGTDYSFTVSATSGDSTKQAEIRMATVGPPSITIKYWQEK